MACETASPRPNVSLHFHGKGFGCLPGCDGQDLACWSWRTESRRKPELRTWSWIATGKVAMIGGLPLPLLFLSHSLRKHFSSDLVGLRYIQEYMPQPIYHTFFFFLPTSVLQIVGLSWIWVWVQTTKLLFLFTLELWGLLTLFIPVAIQWRKCHVNHLHDLV